MQNITNTKSGQARSGGLVNSMQEGTKRIKEIVVNLRNFSRLDESQLKQTDLR